jgi:hypothetical protein
VKGLSTRGPALVFVLEEELERILEELLILLEEELTTEELERTEELTTEDELGRMLDELTTEEELERTLEELTTLELARLDELLLLPLAAKSL